MRCVAVPRVTGISAAIFGALALLASADMAHAQTDLDARLTVAFTLQRDGVANSRTNDLKPVRISFKTKDLIALYNANAEPTTDAAFFVIERTGVVSITDATLNDGAAAGSTPVKFLSDTAGANSALDFRTAAGAAVTPGGTGTATFVGTATDFVAQQNDGTLASLSDMESQKVTTLETTVWTFDEGGVVGGTDAVVLTLTGLGTLASKRKEIGGIDLGMWFGNRSANVTGTLVAGSTSAGVGSGGTLNAILSGTVKATAEKDINP